MRKIHFVNPASRAVFILIAMILIPGVTCTNNSSQPPANTPLVQGYARYRYLLTKENTAITSSRN